MSDRHQFSTRTMFRWLAILAVLLAVVTAIARQQIHSIRLQQAERLLYSSGGTTSHAYALDTMIMGIEGANEHWSWLGRNLFDYVAYIDWSVNSWARTEVEDASQGSVKLAPVDDEAIQMLPMFVDLKWLNLRGAEITDAGLKSLLRLKKLERLDISGTDVTPQGIADFQTANPNCEIINDPEWQSDRSPLAMNYWLRRKLGLIDEQGKPTEKLLLEFEKEKERERTRAKH